MRSEILTTDPVTKKFVLITITPSFNKVETIFVTNDELDNNVLYDEFGIDCKEQYAPLSAYSTHTYETLIKDMELGDKVEIDNDMTLIRLS